MSSHVGQLTGGTLAGAFIGVTLAACGGETGLPERGAALDEVFRADRRIALEEDDDDPVVDVSAVTVLPDGGLLVVDQPASRVRRFDDVGNRDGVVGRPGEGPGELRQPSSAAAGSGDTLFLVQRGGPRLTAYGPDGAPARESEVPGSYGHWVAAVGDGLVVGIGTRSERYAALTRTGETVATFGVRQPAPSRFPAGNFIVDDHQAVAGGRVLVNTSFSPRIRVYDTEGDSVRTFGEPPPSWTGAEPPSPGEVEGGSDEEQMRRWLTSFTIVTSLATVGDSLVVVQHGRHDPTPEQAYRVRHEWIDVYRLDGTKLYEEIPLEESIVAGGDRLYTLGEEPPGPWTIHAYEWVGEIR